MRQLKINSPNYKPQPTNGGCLRLDCKWDSEPEIEHWDRASVAYSHGRMDANSLSAFDTKLAEENQIFFVCTLAEKIRFSSFVGFQLSQTTCKFAFWYILLWECGKSATLVQRGLASLDVHNRTIKSTCTRYTTATTFPDCKYVARRQHTRRGYIRWVVFIVRKTANFRWFRNSNEFILPRRVVAIF